MTLNLWGKPIFLYIIEELFRLKSSSQIYVLTDSEEIKKLYTKFYRGGVQFVTQVPDVKPVFMVSGRAVLLKHYTIEKAIKSYETGCLYSVGKYASIDFNQEKTNISFLKGNSVNPVNAFIITDGNKEIEEPFILNSSEAIVINTKNDFELALVLKRKENLQEVLVKDIINRIKEKESIIRDESNRDGICLIGHSQIDNWETSCINSHKTRNCGIRGISSFEYMKYILKHNMLVCSENIYVIMHGTNDIVYNYSFEEILESIKNTIEYIRKRKKFSRIYFLQCLHVNGRLDRNNKYIDSLNSYLQINLKNIFWINTSPLDDEFGNLKTEYTLDGLHLTEEGYRVLQDIVEKEII